MPVGTRALRKNLWKTGGKSVDRMSATHVEKPRFSSRSAQSLLKVRISCESNNPFITNEFDRKNGWVSGPFMDWADLWISCGEVVVEPPPGLPIRNSSEAGGVPAA